MAPHSSTLAWKMPWAEEPGRLRSMGLLRVKYDSATSLSLSRILRVFPGGASGKESACQCRRCKRCRFDPWVGKIPWRRARLPTPVFLPGEFHGQGSLAGYSPWITKSDMAEVTEHAHTPVVQFLGLCLPRQGVWVWSLVRELTSHMHCSQKPKYKTEARL